MASNSLINTSAPVCTLSDKQLLQDLLNSDIMKSDVVKQQLNMIKQSKVLENHEYAITQTKGAEPRWQTYFEARRQTC